MFGCPTSLFSRTIASQIGLLVWLHRNARFGRPQLASLVQAKSLSRLTSVRPPPSSSFSRGGEGALGCGGGARTPACGRWSTYARTLHRSSALSPARPDVLPGVAPPQPSRMAGSPCGCAPHGRRRSSPTRCSQGQSSPVRVPTAEVASHEAGSETGGRFACEHRMAALLHALGLLFPPINCLLSSISSC